MEKRLFAASYSGGKDCTLAIHLAREAGLSPLCCIMMHNAARRRSWFHGIGEAGVAELEAALGIPIWLIHTEGAAYAEKFEGALRRAKAQGASACVFGDIDVQAHRDWCTARCEAVGLEALFPLWGRARRDVAYAVADGGFSAKITVLDPARVNPELLGQMLTRSVIDALAAAGADPCGENGEYHTFCFDGPLFRRPAHLRFGAPAEENGRLLLPVDNGCPAAR